MQQEVVLAMLAKEPSYGYQLRARLRDALGPLGDAMNAGQVYVTLTRLEKAGLLAVESTADGADRSDRKVYALTPDGQQRVAEWIAEAGWPTRSPWWTPSAASSCAGCATPSAPPWPSPTTQTRRCCWRASCSGCRRTCAGWRHANRAGPSGGLDRERHRQRIRAPRPRVAQALRQG